MFAKARQTDTIFKCSIDNKSRAQGKRGQGFNKQRGAADCTVYCALLLVSVMRRIIPSV